MSKPIISTMENTVVVLLKLLDNEKVGLNIQIFVFHNQIIENFLYFGRNMNIKYQKYVIFLSQQIILKRFW